MRNHLCAIVNISLIPFKNLIGLLINPDTWKVLASAIGLIFFVGFLPFGLSCFGVIAYMLGRKSKQGELWLFISDTKLYFMVTPICYIASYGLLYHVFYKDTKSVFGAVITCNMMAFLFSIIPVFMYTCVPDIYTATKKAYNRAYERCANKEK